MKPKRIVLSGGPGSGKTTLINHIETKGHVCFHEISRAVTAAAQKEGTAQLFLARPLLFSEKLLEGRYSQFTEAGNFNAPCVFYDRGLPDVTSYMDYLGTRYPARFSQYCMQHRYDHVFLLPPWGAIYEKDNERYESFAEAEKIYSFLLKGYKKYNYAPTQVPTGTVAARTQFIFETLSLYSL
ncbi:MAG: AAA family ATPase [Marinirhabdus sp.]